MVLKNFFKTSKTKERDKKQLVNTTEKSLLKLGPTNQLSMIADNLRSPSSFNDSKKRFSIHNNPKNSKAARFSNQNSFMRSISWKGGSQDSKNKSVSRNNSIFFKGSVDLREIRTTPRIKLIRCFYTVLAVVKLTNILEQVKLYGTSTNLYKIAFRQRKAVKKALFPIPVRPTFNNKKKETLPCYLIHPNSLCLAIWNLLMSLLIFYAISFMPYGMVFMPDNKKKETFENYMNYLFIIDILVNFFTAYYNKEGELVKSLKLISFNYVKGFLLLDLLSSIPFNIIFSGGSGGSANKILRIFKIPRLIKMSKLTKFVRLKEMYKGTALSYFIRINGGLIKVIGLTFITVLVLHLAACLWSTIGFLESDIPNTWIYRYNMQDQGNFEIYLTAFYFCFVALTTVGYGDITGSTSWELLFSICWMLFGVAFYSFTIGIISAFFTSKDTKNSLLYKRLAKLEDFCKGMNIDKELYTELKSAIEYSSNKITYLW